MITGVAWECNSLSIKFKTSTELGETSSVFLYSNTFRFALFQYSAIFISVKSHTLLKNILKTASAKEIAQSMKLSISTIYKWAESPSRGSASGIRNPLDRTALLHKITGDRRIINWICTEGDGYFIKNPKPEKNNDTLAPATSRVVSQFAELLGVVAQAAGDSRITKEESENIRQTWEILKSTTEGFVRRCEEGNFRKLNNEIAEAAKASDHLTSASAQTEKPIN